VSDRLPKTERLSMIWILLANNPDGFTARKLADKFDVDVRTIYRDMISLGTDLKVPVFNTGQKWQIAEGSFLPPIRFLPTEALNIFLAARLMLNYSNRYDPYIETAFTKLNGVLPPALSQQVNKTMEWMHKLPKDEKYQKILSTIAEAWISQRQLKIFYQSLAAGEPNERMIDTYFIEPAAPGHACYVIGYCHLKDAVRTFKLERIKSAELTDEHYKVRDDFDANKFFGASWGIITGGEVKTIKLRIKDTTIMKIMEETIWHPSQVLEKQADGSMIMTLNITDTQDFYSWILGWGEKVEVLEPQEIRAKVIDTLKKCKKFTRRDRVFDTGVSQE